MMDMRYMWSAMDSPAADRMLKRRQPSRLVVLRRSRRWRKGRGGVVVEVEVEVDVVVVVVVVGWGV